jgi:PAS domain S-box-containing protein
LAQSIEIGALGAPHAAGAEPHGWDSLSAGDVVEALDRLTDGIMVLGRDWVVRYVNEPAGAMLGRRHSELLGKDIWGEFPEAVGGPFHLAYEDALSTGHPGRLVEYYPPLERWFEIRMFPQEDKLVILFRDVTDDQRTEDELREYVDRISEAERIVRFGVWKWEIASGRVRWSDELHRIYGLQPGEFAGTVDAFMEQLHPEDRERVWANIARSMETLEPFAFEERITRADGAERTLLSQGRVIAGPGGAAQALVGVCHDVTDRAKVEQALGASERRMRAIIDNTPSLISVKDLDGRYLMSNAESERVLGTPADDLVGMRCVDVFPPEIAEAQRANDLRATSEGEPIYGESVLIRDGEPRTFVTVTFPLPDDQGFPVETCTIATDVTERKERDSERRERLEWSGRIASALAADRMLAYTQPIMNLRTGTRSASELLVRMRTAGPRAEVLAPGAFLPAAERFGLIQAIDVWMVQQALTLPPEIAPHVNLSAVTMCDSAARHEIIELLACTPEAASRIVFEITETAAAAHLEAARAFAEDFTDLGCQLALDDFGVGFGSFTYLRSLPLSCIKIDLSFVRGLAGSRDDRRVVQSIIGIAREFGLKTIAEGVEDEATLQLLRALGADFVQGYLLGRPAPLAKPALVGRRGNGEGGIRTRDRA